MPGLLGFPHGRRRFLGAVLVPIAVALGSLRCGPPSSPTAPPAEAPGFPVRAVIRTDRGGIPHIEAADQASLFFALGYVEGRDRLWELEFWRHVADGRLGEVTGNAALRTDGLLRALDLHDRARRTWEAVTPHSPFGRRIVCFTAGLNHYLSETRPGRPGARRLPREFALAHMRPEPWTPVASIEILYLQGLDLDLDFSASTHDEWARKHGAPEFLRRWALTAHDVEYETLPGSAVHAAGTEAKLAMSARARATSANAVPVVPAAQLAAASTPASSTPASSAPAASTPATAMRGDVRARDPADPRALLPAWGPGASNVFALGRSRTASGMPLLANDTHLAHSTPSQWYAVVLEVPDTLLAAGFTVPGLPVLASGRNRTVSWGTTALGANVTAVCAESLDSRNTHALYDGRWESIRSRGLHLSYRLGPLRLPLPWIAARSTRHGLILSQDNHAHRALAAEWYAMRDWPVGLRAIEPETATTARRAADAFMGAPTPALNFVAADRTGSLAYRAVGWVSRSTRERSPLPLPGWQRSSDPAAPIPADSMPAGGDPRAGYLVNANNRPAAGYRYYLGDFYMNYRAQRIDSLVRGMGARQAGIEDMARIQNDAFSPQWARFAPRMLAAVRAQRLTAESRQAVRILEDYDGRPDSTAIAPTLFRAWFTTFAAALGARGYDGFLDALLEDRVAGPPAPDAPSHEELRLILGRALMRSVGDLHDRLGPISPAWSWGRTHRARFRHALAPREAALQPPLVWVPGDNYSIGVAPTTPPADMTVDNGASMRQISDLSQQDIWWMILPPGNSGDPASPHYADQLGAWAEGRYMKVRLGRPLPAEVESEIRLDVPGEAGVRGVAENAAGGSANAGSAKSAARWLETLPGSSAAGRRVSLRRRLRDGGSRRPG